MNNVTSIQKNKQSLINDLQDMLRTGEMKQLIIITETINGEVKTGFSTDSIYDEIGLLELAKQDALKHRGL